MRLAERGRWVLLHHEVPPSNTPLGRRGTHWDLMIENAGALWTWAIQELPPCSEAAALRLPDHRIRYLDYEGPISDGRGTVSRVAGGEFQRLGDFQENQFCITVSWPNAESMIKFEWSKEDHWRIDWSSRDTSPAT